MDDPRQVLQALMGAVKQKLDTPENNLTLDILAGMLGQRAGVVRLALEYLKAAGRVDFTVDADGGLALSKGDGNPRGDAASIEKRLRIALGETTAFRRHFASAPVEELIRDYFSK